MGSEWGAELCAVIAPSLIGTSEQVATLPAGCLPSGGLKEDPPPAPSMEGELERGETGGWETLQRARAWTGGTERWREETGRKNGKGVEPGRVVMEEERRKMPGSRLGHQGKVS